MEKINFSAKINAPKEKVWEVLWNHDSYRAWTAAFAEGSDVETDNWKEGSKVHFTDGKGNGMVARVASNKANEYMSFEHLGVLKDGSEDMSSEEVKAWAGAMENYKLSGENSHTNLFVEMDVTADFKEYMEKAWPIALEKIKDLAEGKAKTVITVQAEVDAPVEKVWKSWSEPAHITKWCQASDDWHAPEAENDLKTGGKFRTVMAAKDGSYSFDFGGVYTKVDNHKAINYTMGDDRKVAITFESKGDKTLVTESFEAENTHSLEMQRGGWQAILDNFKKYTEQLN